MKSVNIIIVTHDVGGAEMALAYLKTRFDETAALFICDGPALFFLRTQGYSVEPVPRGEIARKFDNLLAVNAIELAICSTGITGYELDGLKIAKANGLVTVALMEHWTAYRERFGYPHENWLENIPHRVLFFDEKGLKLARRLGFPEERLFLEGNPCHATLRARYERISRLTGPDPTGFRLLYLSDPLELASKRIFGEDGRFGFDEISLLEDILSQVNRDIMPDLQIVVRRHPMETEGKYDSFTSSWVKTSQKTDLLEDLAAADLIIGSFSTALVTAAIVGHSSISYIPVSSHHLLAEGMDLSHVTGIFPVATKADLAREIFRSYSLKLRCR